jgi:SAM-dependent methyltransferase
MKLEHTWRPSKFVVTPRGLAASDDPGEVAVESRLIVDLIATAYEAALREHATGVLADLGCGQVPLYGVYRERVGEVVCVDWVRSSHDTTHVDVPADLNAPLPLPDAGYDTVLVTDVLEHLADPRAFMSEVSRILRPGGKLILGVPFLYWLHEEPYDYHRFTRYALQAMCDATGLEVITLEEYGGGVAVLLDIFGKAIRWPPIASAFQAVARRLIHAGPVRRADTRLRPLFPLGYCLVARRPHALGTPR